MPAGGCDRGEESSCVALFTRRKFYVIIISFIVNKHILPSLCGFIAYEIISTAVALHGCPSLNSSHMTVT